MSPGIRDPRLNTVECVIEGHETDIMATGPRRSSYITAILWCAFLFSFWAGPFIAEVIIGVLKRKMQKEMSSLSVAGVNVFVYDVPRLHPRRPN